MVSDGLFQYITFSSLNKHAVILGSAFILDSTVLQTRNMPLFWQYPEHQTFQHMAEVTLQIPRDAPHRTPAVTKTSIKFSVTIEVSLQSVEKDRHLQSVIHLFCSRREKALTGSTCLSPSELANQSRTPERMANPLTPSVKWDDSHPDCLRLYLITKKKTGHTPGFSLLICNLPGLCLVFLSAEIRAMRWKEEAALCTPGSQPEQEPGWGLWQPLNEISNGSLQLYNLSLLEVCLLSVVQCCRESPEAPWNKPVQKQGSCLDPALRISFSS